MQNAFALTKIYSEIQRKGSVIMVILRQKGTVLFQSVVLFLFAIGKRGSKLQLAANDIKTTKHSWKCPTPFHVLNADNHVLEAGSFTLQLEATCDM